MPVEFIGMIGVQPEGADGAAVHVIGGAVDTRWLRDFARAHETAGFDRVLVGYTSTSAEGFAVTGYAAAHTERLRYLLAPPPRLFAPPLAPPAPRPPATRAGRGHARPCHKRPRRAAHHHGGQ